MGTIRLLPKAIFFSIFLLGTDLGSKYLARLLLSESETISILSGFIRFSLVYNGDGFLGILQGLTNPLKTQLLYGGVSLLLIICAFSLIITRARSSAFSIALVLVICGGLGNLIDRIILTGRVTDFIMVGTGIVQSGVFNLADCFIILGSFFLGAQALENSGLKNRTRK